MSSAVTGAGDFAALDMTTLSRRLEGIPAVTDKIGADTSRWTIREVGDGNLNLVFIVEGPKGGVVVKQALPYVRLVGESWPLPLKRSFFEYHALTRQEARAGEGSVPDDLSFRRGAGADRHGISLAARHPAPRADRRPHAAKDRPRPRPVRARTLFRGSDLSMPTRRAQADLALFATMSSFATSRKASSSPIPISRRRTEPAHHAAARSHRRRTARRPRPQGRGAAAESTCSRPRPRRFCMATCTPARSWSPTIHPRHRSRIRLLRPDRLRRRHAARQFLDELLFAGGHEKDGDRAEMRAWLLGVNRRDLVGLPRRVRASVAHRAQRHAVSPQPVRGSRRHARLRAGAQHASSTKSGSTCSALPAWRSIAASSASRTTPISRRSNDFDLRAHCERPALRFGRQLAVNRAHLHSIDEVNALARPRKRIRADRLPVAGGDAYSRALSLSFWA
jgi:5-methylthioribose kinase